MTWPSVLPRQHSRRLLVPAASHAQVNALMPQAVQGWCLRQWCSGTCRRQCTTAHLLLQLLQLCCCGCGWRQPTAAVPRGDVLVAVLAHQLGGRAGGRRLSCGPAHLPRRVLGGGCWAGACYCCCAAAFDVPCLAEGSPPWAVVVVHSMPACDAVEVGLEPLHELSVVQRAALHQLGHLHMLCGVVGRGQHQGGVGRAGRGWHAAHCQPRV